MDELMSKLEMLTQPQLRAISSVVDAMLYSEPQSASEWLKVSDAAKHYDKSVSAINSAARKHLFKSRVPNGRSVGRMVERESFEAWLGLR